MTKPILYLFNGKVARFGNAVFGFTPLEVYTVTLDTVSHGSISASPMLGSAGTTIALSNTPDTGYQLGSYSVDGSSIVGSSFSMPDHNVVVGATFSEVMYTITVGTSLNGTVTASAQSATYGSTVTLSSTPNTGYELDHYTVNGVTIVGNTFTMPAENVIVAAVFEEYVDPYNPLGLPSHTIRAKFSGGYTPTQGDSRTLVDSSNNIWDIYKESNDWTDLFYSCSDLREVLGANTTGVTNMYSMFRNNSNLTSVQLFDTSSVTNMSYMFYHCYFLSSIPLFPTSSVTNMSVMFFECVRVQSGALALYQQASSQASPPSNHNSTFYSCGSNTTTGAEELAQIPSGWK